jgi:hypothetical protein
MDIRQDIDAGLASARAALRGLLLLSGDRRVR